ncbi:MAG: cobalt-precorrin-6A synthase, partial [Oscillospiraceae bacterium]|nr:cobalt-precorrin-6A synthase [Oscillospiraceae bacterium]
GMCGASRETVSRLMDSAMTDDMLAILDESGLREQVMQSIMERTDLLLKHRPLGSMNRAVISFSKEYGVLGMTEQAQDIIEVIRKEYS